MSVWATDVVWSNGNQAKSTVAQDCNALYTDVIKRFWDDSIGGETLKLGVDSGALSWVWNQIYEQSLPSNITNLIEEMLPEIQSGKVYVLGEDEGW